MCVWGVWVCVSEFNSHGILGRYLGRYFIYLPHNYNNYLKMPKKKKKNVGRDSEEA